MGVTGLWDIVAPSGCRVNPDILQGRTMAVDSSIWILQFIRAMRDSNGNMIRGAHLVGFFRRICKLLYYRIRPVFVFDGPPPPLKFTTLMNRRQLRAKQENQLKRAAEKLLLNRLKQRVYAVAKQQASQPAPEEVEVEKSSSGSQASPLIEEIDLEKEISTSPAEDEGLNNSVSRGEQRRAYYESIPLEFTGFLAGRRRLDDIRINESGISNLLAMPLASITKKLSADNADRVTPRVFRDSDDFKEFQVTGNQGEERLIQLPLDSEVDPEVFQNLPPKIQYSILTQLRDAWINNARLQGVQAKDDPATFSNVQVESFIRHVRTSREIEKVKKAMAREVHEKVASAVYLDRPIDVETEGPSAGPDYSHPSMDHTDELLSYDQQRTSANRSILELAEGGKLPSVLERRMETKKSKSKRLNEKYAQFIEDFEKPYVPPVEGQCVNACLPFLEGSKKGAQLPAAGVWDCEPGSLLFEVKKQNLAKQEEPSEEDLNVNQVLADRTANPLVVFSLLREAQRRQKVEPFEDEKEKNFIFESFDGSFENRIEDTQSRLEVSTRSPSKLLEGQPSRLSAGNSTPSYSTSDLVFEEQSMLSPRARSAPKRRVVLTPKKKASPVVESQTSPTQHEAEVDEDENWAEWEIAEKGKVTVNEVTSVPEKDQAQGGLQTSQFLQPSPRHKEQPAPLLEQQLQLEQREQHKLFELEKPQRGQPQKKSLQPGEQGEPVPGEPEIEHSEVTVSPVESVVTEEEVRKSDTAPEIEGEVSKASKGGLLEDFRGLQDLTGGFVVEDGKGLSVEDGERRTRALSDYENLSAKLQNEAKRLQLDVVTAKRDTEIVTPEMQEEVRTLLRLCGIPYVDAPAEAEAQCSILTNLNLCDGVISDDSDTLVFGAKQIYRKFFELKNSIEFYELERIGSKLGLSQENFIHLALLLGCDYTPGVLGIGVVNALEVLKAYPSFDSLREFYYWATDVSRVKGSGVQESDDPVRKLYKETHKRYRYQWIFPPGFPDEEVIQAFTKPHCNYSTEPFSWGRFDLDELIPFLQRTTGMSQESMQDLISPLLPRLTDTDKVVRQPSIRNFLPPVVPPTQESDVAKIRSERMQKAIDFLKKKRGQTQERPSLEDDEQCIEESLKGKRKEKSRPKERSQKRRKKN